MSKTINELIKTYQYKIKNIRLEIIKLERERDTLQDVIMDLEELENEESIFVLKKPNLETPPIQKPTKPTKEPIFPESPSHPRHNDYPKYRK